MINNIQNLMDQLSVEYGLNEEILLQILREAVTQAWIHDAGEGYIISMEMQYSKYGSSIRCYKILNVVENVEIPQSQIQLKEALLTDPTITLGQSIKIDLDLNNISRSGRKIAEEYLKNVISQKKKQNEFEYFKNKVGTIVVGRIKAKSNQGIILDIYGFEAIITDCKPSSGSFAMDLSIKAYVYKLEENYDGFQVFLSRNNEEFLIELLKEEIPEVKNGLINIMGIARTPGFGSIILVKSIEDKFNKFNPVSTCIGAEGKRVRNIQDQLHGEKISILLWKDLLFARVATVINQKNKQQFDIKKIILHDEEDERYIEIFLPKDQISRLIGYNGRNIDLISRALGEKLKISDEESLIKHSILYKMSDEEKNNIMNEFINLLNINEEDALTLIESGLTSIEKITNMSFNDFLLINLTSNNHGTVYNKALENNKDFNEKENNYKDDEETEDSEDSEEFDNDYDDDEEED